MDKRLILNYMKWLLRIIASVLCVFFLFFMLSHLFVPDSDPSYVFKTKDIIMFIGMSWMIAGLGIIWLNELISGLSVVCGYLVFSITNCISTGRFYTGEVTLIFLIVGLLILLRWYLELNIKKGDDKNA